MASNNIKKHRVGMWLSFIFLITISACKVSPSSTSYDDLSFDGDRAFVDLSYQVSLGPRYPGSEGHSLTRDWLVDSLHEIGWLSEIQISEYQGSKIYNIIGYRNAVIDPDKPWIVIGAHYDTRRYADRDPVISNQISPVLGANDGASGVAVLLELARSLPEELDCQVWLAFFDAEDNGGINGWDWIIGSNFFVKNLTQFPDAVVIVDMVGDVDQQLYVELNSDLELAKEIWGKAAELGVNTFIYEPKHRIIDDHINFLMLEIPTVDIIDFDYPYWHTTDDTLENVSAESLQNVGDVLLLWVVDQRAP